MTQPEEPKTEISKVCRRLYDGGAIDSEAQRAFICDAISRAHEQLGQVTDLGLMEVADFHVVAGAKMKGYDANQDIERTEPFYLWCRISIEVDSSSIKDWGLCASVGRGPNGVLPTEFI